VAVDAGGIDLLALAGGDGLLFERAGAGLVGRGEALRIPLPVGLAPEGAPGQVADALGAIESDDQVGLPGCGPVAVGALPFDPSAPGWLVVPATVVGRSPDGRAWVTTVGPGSPAGTGGDAAAGAALGPSPSAVLGGPDRAPDCFSLTAGMAHEQWCEVVERTVAHIRGQDLEKVVLAREVAVEANRPIVIGQVLARLRALYPACTVFSVDGFLGASPELLVSRRGTEVRSCPLAGTVPRSGDADEDRRLVEALLASAKDRHEHQVVVDAVAAGLAPVCSALDVPTTPSILSLRNVSHLATTVEGVLRRPAPSALELAARLHPTPAVAGTPEGAALAHIAAVEGFDRGRFAGPVGWVDAHGDGEWVVGIRSANVSGHRARLVAGVGIVADSDPEDELAETQLKLQALLAAVVRP